MLIKGVFTQLFNLLPRRERIHHVIGGGRDFQTATGKVTRVFTVKCITYFSSLYAQKVSENPSEIWSWLILLFPETSWRVASVNQQQIWPHLHWGYSQPSRTGSEKQVQWKRCGCRVYIKGRQSTCPLSGRHIYKDKECYFLAEACQMSSVTVKDQRASSFFPGLGLQVFTAFRHVVVFSFFSSIYLFLVCMWYMYTCV